MVNDRKELQNIVHDTICKKLIKARIDGVRGIVMVQKVIIPRDVIPSPANLEYILNTLKKFHARAGDLQNNLRNLTNN